MISSNALQRTLRIKFGSKEGTAFTIDIDHKQYVITAKHIVSGFKGGKEIEIFHENKWLPISMTLIGESEVDISVLAADQQLTPNHPFPADTKGMILGQDMYFLGFPYSLFIDLGETNNHFPLPLVKKAVLSAFGNVNKPTEQFLLLDGHNNPGFSGGPIVYYPGNKFENGIRVAGVISGYRFEREHVRMNDQETPLSVNYNTGIIMGYRIEQAVEIIKKNPKGWLMQ